MYKKMENPLLNVITNAERLDITCNPIEIILNNKILIVPSNVVDKVMFIE
jgi:hypothetical protein